jgi:single-stranded DNA-binding protein
MNTIAEFTIIGRVGEIRQVGTTLRVNIASSFSRKDNRGEWVERTRWNEVTVFGESTRGYVKRNIVKGDLVFTSGSMGQTKWEKDGERSTASHSPPKASSACARARTAATTRTMSRRSSGGRPAPIRTTSRFEPEPGRPRPPRLSHCPIGENANPWPIRFTASENGNGSAASTAIPPSARAFSRVSTKPKPMLARRPLARQPGL